MIATSSNAQLLGIPTYLGVGLGYGGIEPYAGIGLGYGLASYGGEGLGYGHSGYVSSS